MSETPPTIEVSADELTDSSSFMTRSVRVKYAKADQVVRMLGIVARMQNSII